MKTHKRTLLGLLAPLGVTVVSAPMKRMEAGRMRQIPRSIGRDRSGFIQVEMIGPPNDLQSVTIRGAVPNDNEDIARVSGETVSKVLALMLPDWAERDQWLVSCMRFGLPKPESYLHGPWLITVSKGADSFLSLTASRQK